MSTNSRISRNIFTQQSTAQQWEQMLHNHGCEWVDLTAEEHTFTALGMQVQKQAEHMHLKVSTVVYPSLVKRL